MVASELHPLWLRIALLPCPFSFALLLISRINIQAMLSDYGVYAEAFPPTQRQNYLYIPKGDSQEIVAFVLSCVSQL